MQGGMYDITPIEAQEWKAEDFQQYLRTFREMDKDKSGYIERCEVNDLLKALGYRNYTEQDCDNFLKDADLNKDGKISFREFLTMMKKINVKSDERVVERIESKKGKGIIRLSNKDDSKAGYGYQSFSEEERTAYVKVINSALADDEVCKKYLPIDPNSNELFKRLKNGVLLCKLINKAVPETIDERVINVKDNMNIFNETENLKLGLSAAKSIGVKLVGISADTFGEEQKISIMGVLWQIVKLVVLVKINLKQNEVFPERCSPIINILYQISIFTREIIIKSYYTFT